MKNKSKFIIILGIFLFLGWNTSIIMVQGTVVQTMSSTRADADTYVDTADPLANFGGVSNLKAGFSWDAGDIREAYFHFNFPNKPPNITKAQLSIDIWGISQTTNLTVSIIEASWNELAVDWTNQPTHGAGIGNIVAAESGIYKLDITNLITSRTEISFCINITFDNLIFDYVYITSKEGYSSWSPEDAPQIIWTYLTTQPAIPGYNLFYIIILLSISILLLNHKNSIKLIKTKN